METAVIKISEHEIDDQLRIIDQIFAKFRRILAICASKKWYASQKIPPFHYRRRTKRRYQPNRQITQYFIRFRHHPKFKPDKKPYPSMRCSNLSVSPVWFICLLIKIITAHLRMLQPKRYLAKIYMRGRQLPKRSDRNRLVPGK